MKWFTHGETNPTKKTTKEVYIENFISQIKSKLEERLPKDMDKVEVEIWHDYLEFKIEKDGFYKFIKITLS